MQSSLTKWHHRSLLAAGYPLPSQSSGAASLSPQRFHSHGADLHGSAAREDRLPFVQRAALVTAITASLWLMIAALAFLAS